MIDNWLKDRFVAHRGFHDKNHPENTLKAYERAIEFGFNIELDVQLTKDGVPVLFHDIHLKRLTGYDAYVYEVTFEELNKNIRYIGSNERIPLFTEALELCKNKTGLMIEVKKNSYETDVIDVEKIITPILKNYAGEFIVKSFNPHSVYWLKQNASEFCIGFLSEYPSLDDYPDPSKAFVEKLLFDSKCRVDFFDCAVNLIDSPLCESAREQGLPIIVWTVKSQSCYEAVKAKASNIIFENFVPQK